MFFRWPVRRERRRLTGLIDPLGADPHWFVRLCALAARVGLDDPSEVVYSGIYGDTLSIAAVPP